MTETMKNVELSQFTGHYQIIFPRDHEPAESRAIIGNVLGLLAIECRSAGAEVIGHIKLLATCPEGGYFHGSVTSTHVPAEVEAIGVGVHRSLDISLAALVYGLEKERLEGIATSEWRKLMDTGIVTSMIKLDAPEFHQRD